jgi:hypothetical protein
MNNRSLLPVSLVPSALLLIPLAGNMFVNGWDWDPGSFAFAWVMMAGAAWRSGALTWQERFKSHVPWLSLFHQAAKSALRAEWRACQMTPFSAKR